MSADTTAPPTADTARRRAALEASWRRKVDEVIALSKAYYGLDSGSLGPVNRRLRRSRRLRARMVIAHEQLAVISEALARTSDRS
ncbi:MAG TPA: hypothetical protein VEV45_01060 [Streptosporangiaceae bacterium]|nr:hypothetical protein [Streptosporangiaceae bacterium]